MPPAPDIAATDCPIVLIFGQRGQGKTYLAAHLASAWPASNVWAHNPAADSKLSLFRQCDEDHPPPLRGELLILDEVDLLADARGYQAPWVREAVRRGRHHGITLIAIALRPSMIHKDFRTQWTHVACFRMTDPDDLAAAAKAYGPRILECASIPDRKPGEPGQFIWI